MKILIIFLICNIIVASAIAYSYYQKSEEAYFLMDEINIQVNSAIDEAKKAQDLANRFATEAEKAQKLAIRIQDEMDTLLDKSIANTDEAIEALLALKVRYDSDVVYPSIAQFKMPNMANTMCDNKVQSDMGTLQPLEFHHDSDLTEILRFSPSPSPALIFNNLNGKTATIDFGGKTIIYSGNLPVEESAKQFFEALGHLIDKQCDEN